MTKSIIVRDDNFGLRMATGSRGFDTLDRGPVMGATNGVPPKPSIEVEDLSKEDMNDLRRDPSVRAITQSMPIQLITPTESAAAAGGGSVTWGVKAVGADVSAFDGTGVKVAVLDTGIDPTHGAFAGVNLQMKNFTGGPDSAPDGNRHGTHCAGTIFGRDVGGLRIGVAPGITEAMIGKVLGDDGSGGSEMLFEGMKWAQAGGAKVISMSLGFDFPGLIKRLIDQGWPAELAGSVALEAYRGNLRAFDAIMDMFRAMAQFDGGTVVVAAAGNESERQISANFEVSVSVPAAAFDVISVGALAEGPQGLTVANFSNTNPILSAPGVNVISAKVGGGTVALNGTSMACPHVAGLTALWWQAQAGLPVPLTSDGVKARLRSATDSGAFAAGVDVADRGEGLAKAPPGAGA
ncbi:S8 family serine peptidase [uncultured Paracoccus sp.]|uniref:S8 family peptidase n=1 Tax=uncultured Paracoccus sp. TaxID=189685 RepID=UPI0026237E0E|nr:S8 family serine peptidase [uncultured Paracoccus sp.]